jgi:hypothetical protein
MGGAGYASEYEMEHFVRKALPMTIYAGTSEIQREIIGRSLGVYVLSMMLTTVDRGPTAPALSASWPAAGAAPPAGR